MRGRFPCKPFQPSLIFASKAGAYPSGSPQGKQTDPQVILISLRLGLRKGDTEMRQGETKMRQDENASG